MLCPPPIIQLRDSAAATMNNRFTCRRSELSSWAAQQPEPKSSGEIRQKRGHKLIGTLRKHGCYVESPSWTRRSIERRLGGLVRRPKAARKKGRGLLSLLRRGSPHVRFADLAGFFPHLAEGHIGRKLRNWLRQILVQCIATLLLDFSCFRRILIAMTAEPW
jgi:hypothetical protein